MIFLRKIRMFSHAGWRTAVLCAAYLICSAGAAVADPLSNVRTSWVGNSFGKGLTPNRQDGKWVQNMITYACASPGGMVYTTSGWDEGGRNSGIYGGKIVDGKEIGNVFGCLACCELVNETGKVGKEYAANGPAVAANSASAFAIRDGSIHKYFLNGAGGTGFIGMNARALYATDSKLAAVDRNGSTVKVFDLPGGGEASSFSMQGGGPLAIDHNGDLWIITQIALGTQFARENGYWISVSGAQPVVKHYSQSGQAKGGDITYDGTWFPSCIAIDAEGLLMIGDAGPRRQVLFYDVSGAEPTLVKTLGQEGGIGAGEPGKNAPDKFWTFRGVGADKDNNYYVVCDEDGGVIRKFDKDFKFMWELHSCGFVQSADFVPGTDGRIVMTPNELYTLDYTRTAAGTEAEFTGYTLDLWKYPDDPRPDKWCTSALERVIEGRHIHFVLGMFTAAMDVFRMEGNMAVFSQSFNPNSWAGMPDSMGNMWFSRENKIMTRPFGGFDDQGNPKWNTEIVLGDKPTALASIERVEYDMGEDAVYMTGDIPSGDWGIIGTKMCRISNFVKGNNRTPAWVVDLPYGPGVPGKNRLKAIAFEKDYIFAVGVETKCKVLVYKSSDGSYMGDLMPGPEVNGVDATGWVDIPYGMRALKRSNGEYAVLVEEDGFSKILLFRWCPTGNCPNTQTDIPESFTTGVRAPRKNLHLPKPAVIQGAFPGAVFDIRGRIVNGKETGLRAGAKAFSPGLYIARSGVRVEID
jgi:hypothetical protein